MQKKSDSFEIFLNKLKRSGKTDNEIGVIMSGIAKSSSYYIYEAIMLCLNEEDISLIETIEKEVEAKAKIEDLFKLRTGMTIDELVRKTQEEIFKSSGIL